MAPPIESWPAHELSERIQINAEGRGRKPLPGQGKIDLKKCELLEMVQYACLVEGATEAERHRRGAQVMCRPIERWFRR